MHNPVHLGDRAAAQEVLDHPPRSQHRAQRQGQHSHQQKINTGRPFTLRFQLLPWAVGSHCAWLKGLICKGNKAHSQIYQVISFLKNLVGTFICYLTKEMTNFMG